MAGVNDGLVLLHPAYLTPERTIIVTGLARSGTSMVAAMLHAAGLYLGADLDDIVREDREVAACLGRGSLAELAMARDRQHAVWGFKQPNLHVFGTDIVRALRHPRVILTSRDPVAIARRDILSERRVADSASSQVEAAAQESLAILKFGNALPCPVLLLSYEKAVQSPTHVADAVLRFTGLQADIATVASAVQPGKPAYLEHAQRRYHGFIDGVFNHCLHGWAAERDSASPLALELLIDGQVHAAFTADGFRQDLADRGIGAGHHGFHQALPARLRRMARLSVRVAGRTFELVGSGRTLKSWDGR